MMKDEQGPDMGLIVAWTLALVMTGYWDGGAAGGADALRTPQKEIARLEASGELPVLEREPTLDGIDANTNGVRDDIERHIEKKYTEPAQRKAAMQTARAYQQMLLVNKKDMAALDAASEAGSRAIVCAKSVFPRPDGAAAHHQMSSDLESMTSNTQMRRLAYRAYNKARSGTVSTMPRGDTCD